MGEDSASGVINLVTSENFVGDHLWAEKPLTVDPGNIPEVLCIGKINLASGPGTLMTLTFTHVRPKAGPLFDSDRIEHESVVRARIVMTLDNLIALRDLLNSSIRQTPTPSASSGAAKVHQRRARYAAMRSGDDFSVGNEFSKRKQIRHLLCEHIGI
ncbi:MULTISPECIES: hypothetical protein [unclassified Bradyrhizobium]